MMMWVLPALVILGGFVAESEAFLVSESRSSTSDAYYCNPRLTNPPQYCREGTLCADIAGCSADMEKCQCPDGTPSLLPGVVCSDRSDTWRSAGGQSCSDYVRHAWCTGTGGYGAGWDASWGSFEGWAVHGAGTPAEACCGCGGGTTETAPPSATAPTTSTPTLVPFAHATPAAMQAAPAPTLASTGSAASSAKGESGKCEGWTFEKNCGWTLETNCPGQSPGSLGWASDDGGEGYACCCGQQLWRQGGAAAAPVPIPAFAPPSSPVAAPASSPVSVHGRLRSQGTAIVDESGQPVRLRGMSFYWSQWEHGRQFYNGDAVRWLVSDWGVQVVRAAMGIEGSGGYLTSPGLQIRRVEAIVDAAVELGVYVIVDWHDHRAEDHAEEAAAFFEAAARRYKGVPNVLFETYNEPELEQDWGRVIKPYHERMVGVIRAHNDNLIIMGSRCWCQCVDEAAEDPVAGDNLAYSLHFYAGSEAHRENLRTRARTAIAHGVALFATEWGVCSPVEQDEKDFEESQRWLTFFAENGISDVNWALSDKEEGCAALVPGASPTGGWGAPELTEAGAFIRKTLRASAGVADGCESLCGLTRTGHLGCSERHSEGFCEGSYSAIGEGEYAVCTWAGGRCQEAQPAHACADVASACSALPPALLAAGPALAAPAHAASKAARRQRLRAGRRPGLLGGARLALEQAMLQLKAAARRSPPLPGEL